MCHATDPFGERVADNLLIVGVNLPVVIQVLYLYVTGFGFIFGSLVSLVELPNPVKHFGIMYLYRLADEQAISEIILFVSVAFDDFVVVFGKCKGRFPCKSEERRVGKECVNTGRY